MTFKRKIILLCTALVLILVLLFSFLPAWRQVKNWRALRLIDEASQLVQEQSWQRARERVQAAYQLSSSLPVVRRVAQFYDEVKPSEASGFWLQAYNLSNEKTDLQSAIRSEIMAEHPAQAYLLLDQLLSLHPKDITSLILKAQVLAQLGRLPDAMDAARQALDHADTNPEAQLTFARVALNSPDPVAQTQAIELLSALRGHASDSGLQALRILGELSLGEQSKRTLIQQLTEHPLATIDDKLFALTIASTLPESNPSSNLAAAKKLFSPITLQAKVTLGRWLNRQGRHEQTVEIITPEEALRRQDLFLVYLDALASLERWDVVQQELNRSNVPLDAYLVSLFEARGFRETGRIRQANISWDRAILDAGTQPTNLWYLYRYARRIGWTDPARQVLNRLGEFPSSRRASLLERVQLESLERNTPQTLHYLRELATIYPEDMDIQSDLLYLQLLTGEPAEDAIKQAEALVKAKPEFLAYRMTLALALLRAGQPGDAFHSLSALEVDWNQVRGNWQAVLAAILYANQLDTQAELLKQQIPLDAILPEEKALLEQHL